MEIGDAFASGEITVVKKFQHIIIVSHVCAKHYFLRERIITLYTGLMMALQYLITLADRGFECLHRLVAFLQI